MGVRSPSEPCGRSALVVLPPIFNDSPGMGEIREPVFVETFVAKRAVEALNEGVLRRLAGLDELQRDAVVVGPGIKGATDELGSVIDHDRASRGLRRVDQPVIRDSQGQHGISLRHNAVAWSTC